MPARLVHKTKGKQGSREGCSSENKPAETMPELKETRINLVYKGRRMKVLLDTLQDLGHHGTMTEAVAAALRLYETALLEREKGNQIVVRDKNGAIPLHLI